MRLDRGSIPLISIDNRSRAVFVLQRYLKGIHLIKFDLKCLLFVDQIVVLIRLAYKRKY
ncbi:hypothetical protein HYQ48_0714 [Lactobacillus crispatus]|nr:hypothetical protein [Lactobacillus crispatus]QPP17824.1 hypothetical protein PRL2021_1702 [Lactobacillus crispatus]